MAIEPTSNKEIIHGYIRWSDIFFEWEKVLSDSEREALKGALNAHALVHPDHPLRVEGEEGVHMYIGTLESNAEKRLLMSTAQADYLRQWIYACGLTERIIPIPHSDAVLESSMFTSITREFITQPGQLKELQKTLEKTNKRLKNVTNGLIRRLQIFEQVRQLWASRRGTWLAMDFETWEREHTIVTEFGWAAISKGTERAQGHFKVKYGESVYYNGTYVANNRERFGFGTSEEGQKSALKARITEIIEGYKAQGPLFMVFHDPRDDVKCLESLDAPITGYTYDLPSETNSASGIYVIDTRTLFSALEGENGPANRALERTCQLLGYRPEYMHNAGNDAYWTLKALESMASGEVVDVQRQRRWPHHVPHGPPPPGAPMDLKVPFKPQEEDSDAEDPDDGTEDVLGRLPYDPNTGWARGYGPGEPGYTDESTGVEGDGWGGEKTG